MAYRDERILVTCKVILPWVLFVTVPRVKIIGETSLLVRDSSFTAKFRSTMNNKLITRFAGEGVGQYTGIEIECTPHTLSNLNQVVSWTGKIIQDVISTSTYASLKIVLCIW